MRVQRGAIHGGSCHACPPSAGLAGSACVAPQSIPSNQRCPDARVKAVDRCSESKRPACLTGVLAVCGDAVRFVRCIGHLSPSTRLAGATGLLYGGVSLYPIPVMDLDWPDP